MTTAHVVEMFYSVQGEGVYNGIPSIFVRFAKCNLTCPGFSRKEETVKPYNFIDVKDVSDLKPEDMSIGCDSVYAWHSTARHLWKLHSPESLTEEIKQLIPVIDKKEGALTKGGSRVHLVLTGGEPLLHQNFIMAWLKHMDTEVTLFRNVTFETNGTKKLVPLFHSYLAYTKHKEYLFSLSTKLSSSGESFERRVRADALNQLNDFVLNTRNVSMSLKFVTDGNEQDMEEIPGHVAYFENVRPPVYLMPVGALEEQQAEVLPNVVKAAMDYGYGISMRSHLNFFGNNVGT